MLVIYDKVGLFEHGQNETNFCLPSDLARNIGLMYILPDYIRLDN
jgi:hypothetical protein